MACSSIGWSGERCWHAAAVPNNYGHRTIAKYGAERGLKLTSKFRFLIVFGPCLVSDKSVAHNLACIHIFHEPKKNTQYLMWRAAATRKRTCLFAIRPPLVILAPGRNGRLLLVAACRTWKSVVLTVWSDPKKDHFKCE